MTTHNADLPHFTPNNLRNTLVGLGQTACQTPEEFKAWSQNLGHEKVLTTFFELRAGESPRQGEIIRGLGTSRKAGHADVSELAKALVREMQESGGGHQKVLHSVSELRNALRNVYEK